MEVPHPPAHDLDGLDGLDELARQWSARVLDLAVTLGAAAFCAWQIRGVFVELLDVARGWRLQAGQAPRRTGAERLQEPHSGPGGGEDG